MTSHNALFINRNSVFAALLLSVMCSGIAQAQVAHVLSTKGTALVERAGQAPRILGQGETLDQRDVISVARDSYAILEFNDQSRITLRPNTVFRIDTYKEDAPESLLMGLVKGGFRAVTGLIGKRHPAAVKFQTAVATIGIRGTEFDARLCEDDCAQEERARPAPRPLLQPVARVVELKGLAAASRAGEPARFLVPGAVIYERDGIATGPGSHVVLVFRDDTRVSLAPSSIIAVQDYAFVPAQPARGHATLVLSDGSARVWTGAIAHADPEHFAFFTPTALITPRGSLWDVIVSTAQQVVQTVADTAQDAAQAVASTAQDAAQAVAGAAQQAGQAVAGAAQQTGQAIAGAAQQTGQAVAGAAQQTGQAVAGAVRQGKQAVAGAAQQTGQAIAGAAQQAGQAVVGAAEQVAQVAQDPGALVVDAKKAMNAAEKQAVQAVQQAAKEVGQAVVDAAGQAAQVAQDPAGLVRDAKKAMTAAEGQAVQAIQQAGQQVGAAVVSVATQAAQQVQASSGGGTSSTQISMVQGAAIVTTSLGSERIDLVSPGLKAGGDGTLVPVPVRVAVHAPRPDLVKVDPGLFDGNPRAVDPGLYVWVREGAVALVKDAQSVDVPAGSAAVATRDTLRVLDTVPNFMRFDPTPPPSASPAGNVFDAFRAADGSVVNMCAAGS